MKQSLEDLNRKNTVMQKIIIDRDLAADVEVAETLYSGAVNLIAAMIEQNAMSLYDNVTEGMLFNRYHDSAVIHKLDYEKEKNRMLVTVLSEDKRKRVVNWSLDFASCILTVVSAADGADMDTALSLIKEVDKRIVEGIQYRHTLYQVKEDVCMALVRKNAGSRTDIITPSAVFKAYEKKRAGDLRLFEQAKSSLLEACFPDSAERSRITNWNLDYESCILAYSIS